MPDLPRSVFTGLVAEAEAFETQLMQLSRDYEREKQLSPIFAVDFSELFNYIHYLDRSASRAGITVHILETIQDPLTILPCSVGELLNDMFKNVPDSPSSTSIKQLLAKNPSIQQFIDGYQAALSDENLLVNLYSSAAASLRRALGPLADLLLTETAPAPVKRISSLLHEKILPIEGIGDLQPLSKNEKKMSTSVKRRLDKLRPGLTDNNEADALDAIIAYVLNERQKGIPGSFLSIYTQSTDVINACNAVRGLRWQDDFLVRSAKYLQYRTKLQEHFSDLPERVQSANSMIELCRGVKREAPNLIKELKARLQGQSGVSGELIGLYHRYETEVREFLKFVPADTDVDAQKKRAIELYRIVKDTGKFEGRLEEAFDVLREHLRQLLNDLQELSPVETDEKEISNYREEMLRWLGIPSDRPGSPSHTTQEKGERDEDSS